MSLIITILPILPTTYITTSNSTQDNNKHNKYPKSKHKTIHLKKNVSSKQKYNTKLDTIISNTFTLPSVANPSITFKKIIPQKILDRTISL